MLDWDEATLLQKKHHVVTWVLLGMDPHPPSGKDPNRGLCVAKSICSKIWMLHHCRHTGVQFSGQRGQRSVVLPLGVWTEKKTKVNSLYWKPWWKHNQSQERTIRYQDKTLPKLTLHAWLARKNHTLPTACFLTWSHTTHHRSSWINTSAPFVKGGMKEMQTHRTGLESLLRSKSKRSIQSFQQSYQVSRRLQKDSWRCLVTWNQPADTLTPHQNVEDDVWQKQNIKNKCKVTERFKAKPNFHWCIFHCVLSFVVWNRQVNTS